MRTDDYEGMLAETVRVRGFQDEEIHAYLARPLGPGPHPAVVLAHYRPAWDEWYREVARRFAARGYIAICPDLYCRTGHGIPEDVAARARMEGDVSDEQVVADLKGAARYVSAMPVANGRLATMGTCSGGRHAFLYACQSPELDAAVVCWPGRVVMAPEDLNEKYPTAPIDLIPQLACPMLGIFGNDDNSPPPEDVTRIENSLVENSKEYKFSRFDGAGHGFMHHHKPITYRTQQSNEAWQLVWDFLAIHCPTEGSEQ